MDRVKFKSALARVYCCFRYRRVDEALFWGKLIKLRIGESLFRILFPRENGEKIGYFERDFAQRKHDEADEYSGQHARNSGRAGWRSQGRSVHPSSYVRTGWSLPRISWDEDRGRSPHFQLFRIQLLFPNYLFRTIIIYFLIEESLNDLYTCADLSKY